MEFQTNVKTGEVKINETGTINPPAQVVKEPELITRVSQVKPKEEVKSTDSNVKEPEFDFKDIEAIQDPVAKEQALKAYKSFQKGYNQKFQELAELRKTIEKQKQDEGWTPQRIQSLLNDPNFVQAAQSMIGTSQPAKEEEYLSDKEKELSEKVRQHEAELLEIKKSNFLSMKAQQDTELKNRYANYDAQAVDTITADLLANKIQATREHLWKIYDYENAVQRAYALGKQDNLGQKQEKIQSTSAEGITAVRSDNKIQPEKGESNRDFFRKLFLNNIEKSKTEQIRK